MDIKPAYEHGKFGTFMFNICAKWTKFLTRHRWLYYLLACTWGIIMTVLGVIISGILAFCKLCGCNITFEKFYFIYLVKVGPDYWGGCEMGLMFLRDQKSRDCYINNHEFGHTFQNTLLGPLFPFIVAIPSACRYWYDEFKGLKKDYDAAWFEDAATQCGTYALWYLDNEKEKKADD